MSTTHTTAASTAPNTEETTTMNTPETTAPSTRRSRRPIRWVLALLTLAATGLGGLALSEQVAGASASGTASAKVCWQDQYGVVANGKVRSIVSLPNGRQWVADEAMTGPRGCAWVKFPTNRVVRFTVQQTTGNCSFYCYVTTGNTGWLSSNGTVPGRGYDLGYRRANTMVIDSGYQSVQYLLNNL